MKNTKPVKGIVAFSFALREESEEPNPCNWRLAREVTLATERESRGPLVVVAQWEIDKALETTNVSPYRTVVRPIPGGYLSSEDVWAQAREVFTSAGVTEVIPVAQPFLQLWKVERMIRKDGFRVQHRHIGRVGFDKQSKQWWTRGALRLLFYAVLQVIFGRRGK